MTTKQTDQEIINRINGNIANLKTGRLQLLSDISNILKRNVTLESEVNLPFDKDFAEHFAGLLLVHHALSSEAFTKDKFEHAMVRVLSECGLTAELATRGNPGHDLTCNGEKWSLKTQADKNLKLDKLHISKFMELGKGDWTDDVSSLKGLRQRMFDHMQQYDRIFSLRYKLLDDHHYYELVEIPKSLLLKAESGELELRMNSKQNPKPGYCHVKGSDGKDSFQLYFDGGTERKLQIKNLLKSECHVRANWKFKAN